MAEIQIWFPCSIYTEDNLLSDEENRFLANHCLELEKNVDGGGANWEGGTYTTHGKYEIHTDKAFDNLREKVDWHVHNFASMLLSNGQYESESGWFNINRKGSFQEMHWHTGAVFSAIYYVATPPNSGDVVFYDPKMPDMYPLKDAYEKNNLSFETASYGAQAGKLILFRSYMPHLVQQSFSDEPRISIAMNYK